MKSDYVKLSGVRGARTSEPTNAKRLSEGRIKFLTQGEPVAVNLLPMCDFDRGMLFSDAVKTSPIGEERSFLPDGRPVPADALPIYARLQLAFGTDARLTVRLSRLRRIFARVRGLFVRKGAAE